MTKLEKADELLARITDAKTHELQYYGSIFSEGNDVGTAHISLVSPDGDAVSFTSTINTM